MKKIRRRERSDAGGMGEQFRERGTTSPRRLYAAVCLVVLAYAWIYGGEFLYIALYTLALLPALSLALTLLALRGLRVSQGLSDTRLVKDEPGVYTLTLHNKTPLMFARIECAFVADSIAMVGEAAPPRVYARPFGDETHTIPFSFKYRGEYEMGLRFVKVRDALGLFALKRKVSERLTLTVLPRVGDMTYFPLAANLLSQSYANFEIRDEDYAIVSDIRPYLPSDAMKRVHWKLTAKRQEWLVKQYQSNALNQITLILDVTRFDCAPESALAMEDAMVEYALGLAHYCLVRGRPVEFVAGGARQEGRGQGDFDGMYYMTAALPFDAPPQAQNALTALGKCLDESQHYINAVVLTARPDAFLYERMVSANHAGHFTAAVYFAAAPAHDAQEAACREQEAACREQEAACREQEAVYRKLIESGVSCVRQEVNPLA